jgi:hypothetical protein
MVIDLHPLEKVSLSCIIGQKTETLNLKPEKFGHQRIYQILDIIPKNGASGGVSKTAAPKKGIMGKTPKAMAG